MTRWPRPSPTGRTCGRLEALAAFPELPDTGRTRGRVDGADYARMHADGDLLVMGRRVVPVAELVDVALRQWGHPARIVADYHAERELRQALEAADVPLTDLVTRIYGRAERLAGAGARLPAPGERRAGLVRAVATDPAVYGERADGRGFNGRRTANQGRRQWAPADGPR